VFAARQKLIAAVTAAGLGLSIAAQAIGSPTRAPAERRDGAKPAHHAKLGVLDRPGDHFHDGLLAARHRAEQAQAARAVAPASGSEGGLPSPESLGVSSATLDAIASCESGGDPAAVSADGTYRGKYQFDYGTWASVGGSGDPAAASEAEQDYRAALLYSRGGSSPWPICG
jgi:soluble lytic murein transglycosylase-like protein